MSGVELLRILDGLPDFSGLPALLMTASPERARAELPWVHILAKPFAIEELSIELADLLSLTAATPPRPLTFVKRPDVVPHSMIECS